MRSKIFSIAMAFSLLAFSSACSKKPADNTQANQPAATGDTSANSAAQSASSAPATTSSNPTSPAATTAATATAPQPVTIPKGTVLSVRLGQTLSTKSSNAGDQFTATLAEPIEVGGQTIAPAGARASGTVAEAAPLGRFKGGAKLRISLDSITVNGKRVPVQTSSVARSESGKGKRTAVLAGGGAGLGAIIGGIAGGGKGAAIGLLAGGGAGTAGAAFTGNKDIVIPAEALLSFRLVQPVDVTPQ